MWRATGVTLNLRLICNLGASPGSCSAPSSCPWLSRSDVSAKRPNQVNWLCTYGWAAASHGGRVGVRRARLARWRAAIDALSGIVASVEMLIVPSQPCASSSNGETYLTSPIPVTDAKGGPSTTIAQLRLTSSDSHFMFAHVYDR